MNPFFDFLKNYKSLLLCLFLYLLTLCLTLLDSNHDGVIRNISLNHLFSYVLYSLGLTVILILSTKSKYPNIKNISLSIFTFIFFWCFLEFFCWGINKTQIFSFKLPSNALLFVDANVEQLPRKPFWGDYDATIGKWRLPNDSLQKNRCNDNELLYYRTNSVGARDQERSLKNATSKKRVIFLGDSFVEGIMVNTPDRCSNILEKITEMEHLNFGINGTSPINYYLTYKSLAKKFEHDVVIVGVLPANDFQDYSEGDELGLINYPIYRPYWKSTSAGYELKYSLASVNQAYGSLAIYNNPIKIYETKDSIFRSLSFGQKLKSEFQINSYILGLISQIAKKQMTERTKDSSIFQDFPKDKWATFSYSLEKLIEEAKGKQIIIVTIPTLKDILLYQKTKENILAVQLSQFCKNHHVQYLDLLPLLSTISNPSELYVECDGHWNEKGEKMAAEFLLKSPVYKAIVTF